MENLLLKNPILKKNLERFHLTNCLKEINHRQIYALKHEEKKYYNNTDNDAINIPSLPFETTETTGNFYELDKCSFISSNFITLKKDYYNNKDIKNYNVI